MSAGKFSVNLSGVRFSTSVNPAGFPPVSAKLIEDIVRRIVIGVAPEKVILFGSYSKSKQTKNNPTADSDLDLLVIMETSARPVDRVLAISRLLRPRPFPMDILVRTAREIDDLLENGDSFIQEIMTQGTVLYERRD